MTQTEWPAEDYAIGSYIQAAAARPYIEKYFSPPKNAYVLDIGCGDGHFSIELLPKIPEGQILGIDASDDMLALAQMHAKSSPQFHTMKADIENIPFEEEFDYIISFWCLQWTSDIASAFQNIRKALKPGGKFLTIFPSGDDPFMQSFIGIRDSGEFPELQNFHPPMDYKNLENLADKLRTVGFSELNIIHAKEHIELPNLEIFKRFIYGIGFFQGQYPPEKVRQFNDAMIQWYKEQCQNQYQGKWRFDFSPYCVIGSK